MQKEGASRRIHARLRIARLLLGLTLLLVYVLPVYLPPPARLLTTPAAGVDRITFLFPNVPRWWVISRLVALLLGALLLAAAARGSAFHWRRPLPNPPFLPDTRYQTAALIAAALHFAAIPWIPVLTILGQTVFMLWLLLPTCILLAGSPAWRWQLSSEARSAVGPVAAVVGFWCVSRTLMSWHTPVAADMVDMWRTFGGLRSFALDGGNFLTQSMTGDRELQGVNAIQLFFQGLPILTWLQRPPSLTWFQAGNTLWIGAGAACLAALTAEVAGASIAVVAAAAFLFSPFNVMWQLSPTPGIAMLLPVLSGLLLVHFYRSPSPIVLVFFAAVAGVAATIPMLVPMTGLALLLVLWKLRSGPPLPLPILLTAALCFAAVCVPSIPGPQMMQNMFDSYAATYWPWAISERALQGQHSPTIQDWTNNLSPGSLTTVIGTLLSPFAQSRNSLRAWGDVLHEPLSAALGAVGIAVCLRHAARDRLALCTLAFLAASLLPGFISSYDRPAVNRVYGSLVPMALLAAVGLKAVGPGFRPWLASVVAVAIAASGTFIFDVVNPRILPASSFGLLMRAVEASQLDRVAMLTSRANAVNPPDVDDTRRQWHADWLRRYHTYVDDILLWAPRSPVPIVAIEETEELARFEVFFWNPALESSAAMRQKVCARWPGAPVYTISDQIGFSRVFAVRPGKSGWKPAVADRQWSVAPCNSRSPFSSSPDDS